MQQLQKLSTQKALGTGERELFFALPTLLKCFRQFPLVDQQLLKSLVLSLTQGMEMDLVYFGTPLRQSLRALPDLATLDLYTHYVAGVVGEFWTKIHYAHMKSLQHCNIKELCDLGIHFGKGLQLTNILKDLGKDMSNGRCYLPQDHLEHLGLEVGALQEAPSLRSLRPLLIQLVQYTLQHLDQAQKYLQLLPWRPIRMRLSCMWPLLFAVQTLDEILQNAHVLQPNARVKISRWAVYRTMLFSLPCAMSHRLSTKYYESLAGCLQTTLATATFEATGPACEVALADVAQLS